MNSDVGDDDCGTIGYEEFLMMTHKILNRNPKDEVLKACRLFDDNEMGKISFKDKTRVASELGERMRARLSEPAGIGRGHRPQPRRGPGPPA
mmetsp:Transcript_98644/g.255028  ORF Transcript_98644/g.255028 Transcript_98644/m.255028 type:complete len:92 (-) Transcript_98644:97-372(-)